MEGSLLSMCVSSFAAVFTVLSFLAIAMRLIIMVFPEKVAELVKPVSDDEPIFAAISSVYAKMYPGARVTKIEEVKEA